MEERTRKLGDIMCDVRVYQPDEPFCATGSGKDADSHFILIETSGDSKEEAKEVVEILKSFMNERWCESYKEL